MLVNVPGAGKWFALPSPRVVVLLRLALTRASVTPLVDVERTGQGRHVVVALCVFFYPDWPDDRFSDPDPWCVWLMGQVCLHEGHEKRW